MDLDKLRGLAGKRIVVVGDVLVDYYRILRAERISPEAPVIIYRPVDKRLMPGGAANVAKNLLSLGVPPGNLSLCGMFGPDWVDGLVGCRLVAPESSSRKTTVKERIVTNRQQVLRIDDQAPGPADRADVDSLSSKAREAVRGADCLVFSDYDHGAVGPSLVEEVMAEALRGGIPVVVDSKAPDTVRKYSNATIMLPNKKELYRFEEMRHGNALQRSDAVVVESLVKTMGLRAIGMTMGAEGILLAEEGKPAVLYPPLEDDTEDEVVDVTGAGDTVTATVAACLSVGMPYDQVIRTANVAAGIVVQKQGVASATLREIESAAKPDH